MIRQIAAAGILLFTISIGHAAPGTGDKAPEFRAVSGSGAIISLSGYSGRIVILDFFTTWCHSCRELTSLLVDIDKKSKGGNPVIIAMNVEDTGTEKINAYMREKGIRYPVVYAEDSIQNQYGIRSIPSVYVIGKDGTIAGKFTGFNREIATSLEALLRKML